MTTPLPTHRDICRPDEARPDTPSRWQAAYARAVKNELTVRPGLFGTRYWTVSSASRPDLAHATDGDVCSCTAAADYGDPVCQHRALVRKIEGRLPEVPAAPAPNVTFIHRRSHPAPAA